MERLKKTTRLSAAIRDIHEIDDLARSGGWLQKRPPTAKVLAALLFIVSVMSQDRYAILTVLLCDLTALFFVAVFHLPWRILFHRLRYVGFAVLLLGAANPFFDRQPIAFCGFLLTGGVVSLLVLLGKAFAAVTAAFILTAGTTMPEIGRALRKFGVPMMIATTILLIYRYLVLILIEADKMQTAYNLRSSEKPLGWREWTSLTGRMLLRSIDRAERIGAAMELRGFDGELP